MTLVTSTSWQSAEKQGCAAGPCSVLLVFDLFEHTKDNPQNTWVSVPKAKPPPPTKKLENNSEKEEKYIPRTKS